MTFHAGLQGVYCTIVFIVCCLFAASRPTQGHESSVGSRSDLHAAQASSKGLYSNSPAHCSPQAPRTDCGYFGIQQPECEARGCCWSPVAAAEGLATERLNSSGGAPGDDGAGGSNRGGSGGGPAQLPKGDMGAPNRNDVPWCYFPNGREYEPVYEVESVQPPDPGGAVTTMVLRLRSQPGSDGGDTGNHQVHPRWRQQPGPGLGPDVPWLEVRIEEQEAHRLYIRVRPVREEATAAEATVGATVAAGEAEGPPRGRATGSLRQRQRGRRQEQRVATGPTGGVSAASRATEARLDVQGAEPRWQVPQELLPRPPAPSAAPAGPLYRLELPAPGQEFGLRVSRSATKPSATTAATVVLNQTETGKGNRRDAPRAVFGNDVYHSESGDVLLDLSGGACLVFKPQFLQLRAQVPSDINLYGMGETTQAEGLKLPRDGSSRALWNSDTPAAAVGVNLYGSHPVLYGIAPSGASFGWFLANSNAMDFTAGPDDVSFRAVGGILELFVFCGPSPERVTAQYQQVVGRPAMPPRWALGFHQSRYGYGSVDELEQVVASYDQSRIPLEVMWSDIDYTDRARMFTTDPQHYPLERLRGLADSLHASGRRWVPIVDCGITALPGIGYEPYERGLSCDVFIKDSSGQPLMGQVWSGPTHWPDFMHPNATPYWTSLLAEMHDKLPYDGLWLDMNEPSNFCTGECRLRGEPSLATAMEAEAAGGRSEAVERHLQEATIATVTASTARIAAATSTSTPTGAAAPGSSSGALGITCVLDCTQPAPDDPLSNPPYRVNNGNRHVPLYGNTVPLTAMGYDGVRQYDAHNLYALAESRVTHAALRAISPGSRPFILTRSSWAGQGRFAAHWTGDNAASWDDLRRSAGGLLASSLAGMAMAGADICGFMGATNEQLCARWLAAGAFYTFSRDHSDLGSPPQEPYRWPLAAEAARNALAARYSLLPYLYTAFFLAHTRGGTVARPLVWAAPADPRVADLSSQWLLGDALLVAPVMTPDKDQVEVYFPGPASAPDPDTDPDKRLDRIERGGASRRSGTWCRYGDLGECYTGPSQQWIRSPLGSAPPLFLRAGCIVPTQPLNASAGATGPIVTTSTVAASPLTLLVLLSAAGSSDSVATGLDTGPMGARSSFASGSGSSPLSTASTRDEVVAFGRLFADNGTDPDVGGPESLRVRMAAGASLAEGSGWFEYRVEGAPAPAGLRRTVSLSSGASAGSATGRGPANVGAGAEAAEAAADGDGASAARTALQPPSADLDVRHLRVGEVVVVGVALPPGCPGMEVTVVVGGTAPVVLTAGVHLDTAAHRLQLEGLDLAGVQSFRLAWKPHSAPT